MKKPPGSPAVMDRRALLGLLAAAPAVLIPRRAAAIGPRSRFRISQLRYNGGNWNPRGTGLRRLAWEVEKRTSVDIDMEPVPVRASSPKLFSHPFLYMGGDKAMEPLSAPDLQRLNQYLIYGGTLVIDSADARPGGEFDKSVRRMVSGIFPRTPMKKLKQDHTLFKSFYLLKRPVGRVASVPHLEGVSRDGRTMLIYCQNDLAGAWSRDNFGQWEHSVYPGGDRQRELAIRWGINIVMYALCVNYKADQVHIPFILKRRRWQVD